MSRSRRPFFTPPSRSRRTKNARSNGAMNFTTTAGGEHFRRRQTSRATRRTERRECWPASFFFGPFNSPEFRPRNSRHQKKDPTARKTRRGPAGNQILAGRKWRGAHFRNSFVICVRRTHQPRRVAFVAGPSCGDVVDSIGEWDCEENHSAETLCEGKTRQKL